MIQYLRIPKNKFWGWVFSSLAIGLLIGAVTGYAVSRSSQAKQIDDLKQQMQTQASEAASSAAGLQEQLDSRDASLSALAEKNTALQAEADSAKATSASDSSGSSSDSTATLEVKERTVRPDSVATGDNITLTARVQGRPDKVTMRIYNKTSGYDETYSLKRTSRGETIDTWRAVVEAPGEAGTYLYYATAYLGDKSATQPGASPGSLKVE